MEQNKDSVVEFLQDLVRIHSVNGVDTELLVAQRIEQEARKLGVDVQLIAHPDTPQV